jgi:type IV secretory pathway VirB6-like protein
LNSKGKYFTLIVLLFLGACGNDGACWESYDYGDSGNVYTTNVFGNSSNCSWNIAKSMKDNNNSTIKTCLNDTTAKNVWAASSPLRADVCSSGGSTESSCQNCFAYTIENIKKDNVSLVNDTTKCSGFDKDAIGDDIFAANEIFSTCVDYCQNECKSSANPNDQLWVKPSLISSNAGDGYGVIVEKDTVYSIKATGSVILTGGSSENSVGFEKIGDVDIKGGKSFANGSEIKTFKVSLFNIPSYDDAGVCRTITASSGNKESTLSKIVLSFTPKNTELSWIDGATVCGSKFTEYDFQHPHLASIQCGNLQSSCVPTSSNCGLLNSACAANYSKVFENAICSNDNATEVSYRDDYIVKLNDVYSLTAMNGSIFKLFTNVGDDYYYYYSNNVADNVELSSGGALTVSSSASASKKPVAISLAIDDVPTRTVYFVTSGPSSNQRNDSYYWNGKETDSLFTFSVNKPTKLALKNMGATTSCKYIIEEKKSQTSSESTKIYGSSAGNLYVTSQSGKWTTVKDPSIASNPPEVIFNQFSIPGRNITRYITIRIADGATNDCKKLLVKMLPLKDLLINTTGILFLAVPSYKPTGDNPKTIKYSILNPKTQDVTVDADSDGVTADLKNKEFFETSEENKFTFLEAELLSWDSTASGDLSKIDKNNYGDLVDKRGIFVRKNQIVRFDYSNWLSADGKSAIEIKKTGDFTIPNTTEQMPIPIGLNMVGIIKEKNNFICMGSMSGIASVEAYCAQKGGKITNIFEINEEDEETEKEKCFNSNDASYISNCMVKTDSDLRKIYNTCTNTTLTEGELNSSTKMDIRDFIAMFLTSYYNDSNDNSVTTCLKNNVLQVIATKAKDCLNHLKTANSDFYSIERTRRNESGSTDNDACGYSLVATKKYKSVATDGRIDSYLTCYSKLGSEKISIDDDGLCATGGGFQDAASDRISFLKGAFIMEQESCSEYNIEQDDIDISGKTISYKSFMDYFNVPDCDLVPGSNMCSLDGASVPICYDLTDYVGSMRGFYSRTHNGGGDDLSALIQFGKLHFVDRSDRFGAKRIQAFEGTMGTMADFIEDSGGAGYPVNSDNSAGVKLKYNSARLVATSTSYIGIQFLNDLDGENLVADDSTFLNNFKKEFFKSSTCSAAYIKISTTEDVTYRNGQRLAAFFGKNDKAYSGDDVEANGSKKTDFSDVKYLVDVSSPLTSKFIFDENGYMTSKTGSKYLHTSTESDYNNYIQESGKNLFFRIIDVDGASGNNSGSYRLVITSFVEGQENAVVTKFKEFLTGFFALLDGKKIRLMLKKGADNKYELQPCEEAATSDKCYIYDKEDIIKNGMQCSKDTNPLQGGFPTCFKSCDAGKVLFGNSEKCFVYNSGSGFVQNIFERFTANQLYQFVIKLSLVLMLTLYGFNFFIGKADFKTETLIYKVIRVSFIYFIISESGWKFFEKTVVGFMKDGIDSLLFLIASAFESDLSSKLAQAVSDNNFTDKTVLFQGGLDNIKMLLSEQIMSKTAGLAFSSIFGLIYVYLILTSMLAYLVAMVTAIILYLNAQLYISLVLSLFPVVIMFLMFDKTKKSLENWFDMMLGFIFQQIFLILTLSFFNAVIRTVIKNVFSYRICWMYLFSFNFLSILNIPILFWKVPTSTSFLSGSLTNAVGFPSFYSILMFYLFGTLMGKFLSGMTNLGQSLAGGSVSIAGGIAGAATKALDSAKKSADSFMKGAGKTFGKQMASRVGLDSAKKYNADRDKKLKERKEKQKAAAGHAKSEASKKNEAYVKSSQYQKDVDNHIKEKHGDISGKSKKDQEKIKNDARKEMAENNYNKEYANVYTANRVQNDDDLLKRMGHTRDEYNKMNDDEKKGVHDRALKHFQKNGEVRQFTENKTEPNMSVERMEIGGDAQASGGAGGEAGDGENEGKNGDAPDPAVQDKAQAPALDSKTNSGDDDGGDASASSGGNDPASGGGNAPVPKANSGGGKPNSNTADFADNEKSGGENTNMAEESSSSSDDESGSNKKDDHSREKKDNRGNGNEDGGDDDEDDEDEDEDDNNEERSRPYIVKEGDEKIDE